MNVRIIGGTREYALCEWHQTCSRTVDLNDSVHRTPPVCNYLENIYIQPIHAILLNHRFCDMVCKSKLTAVAKTLTWNVNLNHLNELPLLFLIYLTTCNYPFYLMYLYLMVGEKEESNLEQGCIQIATRQLPM